MSKDIDWDKTMDKIRQEEKHSEQFRNSIPLECLGKQYTIKQAEQEWMVHIIKDNRYSIDPQLKLPMGYLNEKWNDFKSRFTNHSQLWTYTIHVGFLWAESGWARVEPDCPKSTKDGKPRVHRVAETLVDWVS